MEALYPNAGGLDVHKKTVVACRRRLIGEGLVESEVERFGATLSELLKLLAWLKEWGVTHVAMESTGVYWIPVWGVLEKDFKLLLTNAQHLKKVPGRKTDVTDSEWIAQCMQCGLLRFSFVPDEAVQSFRDLTRQRTKLLQQRTAVVNRVHKVLQQASMRLSSVASDVMGQSGRAMLTAMVDGETDPAKLASLARGDLREKRDQLEEGLRGKLTENQRWQLGRLLKQADFLQQEVEIYSNRLKELMRPFEDQLARLDTIHGVGRRTAEILLAELGPDMRQFPSADNLCSWAGMSPGNRESAGKRSSGFTPSGNRWLKGALVEAAWAGINKKDSYLGAQYHRLAARRGKKRAIVAVGHTILVAAYWILKDPQTTYEDLGATHFDRMDADKTKRHLVQRLEKLGYVVDLKPAA
jgi:transposase